MGSTARNAVLAAVNTSYRPRIEALLRAGGRIMSEYGYQVAIPQYRPRSTWRRPICV